MKKEKSITLEQLKMLAETFTHAMREIDADAPSVKLIN